MYSLPLGNIRFENSSTCLCVAVVHSFLLLYSVPFRLISYVIDPGVDGHLDRFHELGHPHARCFPGLSQHDPLPSPSMLAFHKHWLSHSSSSIKQQCIGDIKLLFYAMALSPLPPNLVLESYGWSTTVSRT